MKLLVAMLAVPAWFDRRRRVIRATVTILLAVLTLAGPASAKEFDGLFPLAPSLWSSARLNLRGVTAPVHGSGRRDVLRGTARRDGLHGRAGNDRLLGFAGNDSLYGGDGDDVLFGRVGNDRFFGRRGRDLVYAGPGKDWADGGLGDDRTLGGDGDDVLFGGPGNDHISGGAGNDYLYGNAGDDFINAADGRRDLVECGNDVDLVIADRGDRFLSRDECEEVMDRFDRRGISFVYPASWFVSSNPLSQMRDPDYRFAVATWPVHNTSSDRGPCLAGIAARRPADGALAFLGESIGVSRKHSLPRLPAKPRRFRLPTAQDGDSFCLGNGSVSYHFKDAGRALVLGISIGPNASAATRRALAQLLHDMEIRPLNRQ